MTEVEQRLREIEERVSKASPPPWFYHPMRGAVYSKGTPILAVVEDVNSAFTTEFADLIFVENAREDIPWLLSLLREREEENRRLRERLDRLEGGIQRLIQSYGGDSRDSESGGTSASGLKACRIRNLSL